MTNNIMIQKEFFLKAAYSDLIPRLSARDYERLKKSIRDYGLQYPIIINGSGIVLDGHHRLQACQELGIEPAYITKDFAKPLEELKFVITVNINSRQLNEFQRAQIALNFKRLYAGKETKMSKDRMKATQFNSVTGRQAAIKRHYGSDNVTVENLITETQKIFGN